MNFFSLNFEIICENYSITRHVFPLRKVQNLLPVTNKLWQKKLFSFNLELFLRLDEGSAKFCFQQFRNFEDIHLGNLGDRYVRLLSTDLVKQCLKFYPTIPLKMFIPCF